MKVVVTGGSGFIGRALCERLGSEEHIDLHRVVRSTAFSLPSVSDIEVDDIGSQTLWANSLQDVDVVIHAAARAHVTSDSAANPLNEFRRVNVDGTMNLARQAMNAGVRRFIFISSIKVNGEMTACGRRFSAGDQTAPADAYAKSKCEAEVALQGLAKAGDMELVVIRPPLVYGPGVRANFLAMMRWIHRGWPVPLGRVNNKRSLVALDNLVDLIATCASHPAAANQIFTVSDDEDISTSELARRIGVAVRNPAKLVSVPVALLRTCASFAGKSGQLERIVSSLQVDIAKTRDLLGWAPVINMEKALQETARHYLGTLRT